MKTLLLGIAVILLVGIGGFFYRNAIEHPLEPVNCPVATKTCPDGSRVASIAPSCTFMECLPPNVSLADVGIAFALPEGVTEATPVGSTGVAAYDAPTVSSTEKGSITIDRFAIMASTTALDTIKKTAIGDGSGLPVPATSFTSTTIGTRRFTVVNIGRFEGVVTTAYYLARGTDVLRFDAIDRGVDWTNPNLDVSTLPTHMALRKLLATLQAE